MQDQQGLFPFMEPDPEPPFKSVFQPSADGVHCSIQGCNRQAVLAVSKSLGGDVWEEYYLCDRHRDFQKG